MALAVESLRSAVRVNCRRGLLAGVALLLAACQVPQKAVPPSPPAPTIKTLTQARYEAVTNDALPALADSDLVAAWPALLASCRAFERGGARREVWAAACRAASAQTQPGAGEIRAFVTENLRAWRVLAVTREEMREDAPAGANGAPPRVVAISTTGRMTGYYEPQLAGSRDKRPPYLYPLHRVPPDLLTLDLASVYPELAGRRVRGRLEGRRVVPYWSRAEINHGERLRGAELLWVDDEMEAFLLQIQGSGRVRLPDGQIVRVGYADTNGHPYQSIGRLLVERGELKLEEASLQGIRAWASANGKRLAELLNANPSYVFFRETPLGDPNAGPLGALNVALTPGYSVAVDPQFIPLGSPLVLASVHPTTGAPLTRLMLAQDVGGAIRGPLRFDFFWGSGQAAGAQAGRQRHNVSAWLLLPKGVQPEDMLAR